MSDIHLPAEHLSRFMRQVLERHGCSDQHAAEAADVLLWASLRGIDTHGVRLLKPNYVEPIKAGVIDPRAEPTVDMETDTTARLDGNSGLGLAGATYAMRLAIEKAQTAGIGMVAVHNTHHLGAAGFFAHLALRHGMLGACLTGHFFGNGNEYGIAPINSRQAMFSTNPLSFAAPCGRHPPFLLDMASAVTTVNRIVMLRKQDKPIPDGWAKDSAGQPTRDPNVARILYPLGGLPESGGHKGIGLAMMVSILSGVLSGGWTQLAAGDPPPYDQPTMGHFFAAIRIDQFMPVAQFEAALEAMIDAVRGCREMTRRKRFIILAAESMTPPRFDCAMGSPSIRVCMWN